MMLRMLLKTTLIHFLLRCPHSSQAVVEHYEAPNVNGANTPNGYRKGHLFLGRNEKMQAYTLHLHFSCYSKWKDE